MTVLFEILFNAWCPPYDPALLPEHLQGDPIKGYGQLSFERGFRLAMNLMAAGLDRDLLSKME